MTIQVSGKIWEELLQQGSSSAFADVGQDRLPILRLKDNVLAVMIELNRLF